MKLTKIIGILIILASVITLLVICLPQPKLFIIFIPSLIIGTALSLLYTALLRKIFSRRIKE